jgi:cysteine sulfinate desulfinase/cysteine desulfurase-like protein
MLAMGLSADEANEALRVSFGRSTTVGDVDTLLGALTTIIKGVAPCP